MAKWRASYATEFRKQMVDLVRAGRTPEDPAREFELSLQAILRLRLGCEVNTTEVGQLLRLQFPSGFVIRPSNYVDVTTESAIGVQPEANTGNSVGR